MYPELDKLIQYFSTKYAIEIKEKQLPQLKETIHQRADICTNGDKTKYLKEILENNFHPEWAFLIDKFTIKETYFFRNKRQFDYLQNFIIPELMNKKGKWQWEESGLIRPQIRVLSAACSTGEEPYSIAISFAEKIEYIKGWDVKIEAFDISPSAINKAKSGRYESSTLRFKSSLDDANTAYFEKYFDHIENGSYIVRQDIRDLVQFKQMNLKDMFDKPSLLLPKYDVIFCRNVMIYFNYKNQAELIRVLTDSLVPGGYLMMGDAEALHLYEHELEVVNSIEGLIYQKTS